MSYLESCIRVVCSLVFVATLAGCGSGGSVSGGSGPAPVISVSIATTPAAMIGGATQSFAATVTNDSANAGVTWSVSGGGSFSPAATASGTATIYTAALPVPGATSTLTATSKTDPTKSASVTVPLTPISLAVTPAATSSVTLTNGATQQFSAAVANDITGSGVNWTTSAGTITSAGVYTAPTVSSTTSATITATSKTDSTKISTAMATVVPNATVIDLSTYANLCGGTNVTYSGAATYPVCLESIAAAMGVATTALNGGSGSYILNIDAGTYDLSSETLWNHPSQKGVFVPTTVWPTAANAVLYIQGSSTGNTTIISDSSLPTIWALNLSHVHFNNLTFQRGMATVGMGLVSSFASGHGTTGSMKITVPSNFPSPIAVWQEAANVNSGVSSGGTSINAGYIRAYTNAMQPQLIGSDPNNTQIGWSAIPTANSDGTFTITFNKSTLQTPDTYSNNFACLKMVGIAQAYYFNDISGGTTGTDVGFNNVTWYDQARGVWRNIINPFVTNSYILPHAPPNGPGTQGFCMSTPDGGPQFGQPGDGAYPLTGVYVNNLNSDRSGDDTIAIFNASDASSTITSSTINSAFARDINLYYSCFVNAPYLGYGSPTGFTGPTGTPNVITNCGINNDYPTQYNGCITDTAKVCTNFPL